MRPGYKVRDNRSAPETGGIIFEGNSGQVYGDPAVRTDVEIPKDKTLTIPNGSTLTIENGVKLTDSGKITNNGDNDQQRRPGQQEYD